MVNYGKIMALHNAGWDSHKIADEMRLSDEQYLDAITDKFDEIDAEIKRLEREYQAYVSLICGREVKRGEKTK